MEINDPSAVPNATWYVINGLLAIELITGRRLVGFNQFEERQPATFAQLATMASFPHTLSYGDLPQPRPSQFQRLGRTATGFLSRCHARGVQHHVGHPATLLMRGENTHGWPSLARGLPEAVRGYDWFYIVPAACQVGATRTTLILEKSDVRLE
jgi:hypothetical protein